MRAFLDSGGTIWLLWVYRDPVGIKIDSVGTSRRKWPVPKLYRLIYLHILISMRLKWGKFLPPSSEDNTCVARTCIPYFWHLFWIPVRLHKIKSLWWLDKTASCIGLKWNKLSKQCNNLYCILNITQRSVRIVSFNRGNTLQNEFICRYSHHSMLRILWPRQNSRQNMAQDSVGTYYAVWLK